MANTNIHRSSRVEQARQHLDQAVSRLEQAVQNRLENRDQTVADQTLADQALVDEVQALRTERAGLRDVNETVSKRLESVVDRLQVVLEG